MTPLGTHVLPWACRVEAKRAQESALNEIKEVKDYDAVKCNMLKWVCDAPRVNKRNESCKHCGPGHLPCSSQHTERNAVDVESKTTQGGMYINAVPT